MKVYGVQIERHAAKKLLSNPADRLLRVSEVLTPSKEFWVHTASDFYENHKNIMPQKLANEVPR